MEELHENSHCRWRKGGEVICQELSTEENDIVLIDQNQDIIDRLMNKFDIMGICGNGASYDISVEAGDFLTAFSSVAAIFNNIGPGLGQVGPTSNFSMYSEFNTFLLSIGMIAGRLEIYPIILLFSPTTFKSLLYKR